MVDFGQTSILKVVGNQILSGKMVSQASFESHSLKLDRFKNLICGFFQWSYSGLRDSNEACDTTFPVRI